ncbi:hypothetical protein CEE37_06150 [candidate division LCP-89 bacterium B3_LCP]|uniref:HDOD domain-containing protein n=1 Tax=candidate division LCP-89 bacterium B3_LCP TaxID=2012998 RepID=A0A532V225_UNCL8|nr:MAG: hypothetical protein CEE37_06150 [candidate division LCP-89 bacterium B3_LCP]
MLDTEHLEERTMIEQRSSILEQLDVIDNLPTLPNVFLRIMQLMRDPEVSMKDIAEIIESDPAISMKILKLINSTFYGLSKQVDSIQQSIVLLGSSTIKNVVISISIFKVLNTGKPGTGFNRKAFWQHSIGCGLIARYISNQLGWEKNEDGFIAGVTHDIGKVILDRFFPEQLVSVMEHIKNNGSSFYEAETITLGTSHSEIGSLLAENWKLPEKLVHVIAQHHSLEPESEHAGLIALIQLADMLTYHYKIGSGGAEKNPPIDPNVWSVLSIEPEILQEWDEELKGEIANSQELGTLLA